MPGPYEPHRRGSLSGWASEHAGACPATIDELVPYGDATDLWGRDYVMRCDLADPRTFALTSRGPDRRLGTKDDITVPGDEDWHR